MARIADHSIDIGQSIGIAIRDKSSPSDLKGTSNKRNAQSISALRTHHHSLLLHLLPLQSRCRHPRSLSPRLPNPHVLQKILPLPCPLPRTNAQRRASSTWVKLVVDAREHLSNRSGVADHANSAHDLGEITTWHDSWWLVVDATFKSCRGPIHKLDCTLGLYSCHACVHVLGHHISTVHHAASHVLTMTRIALDHHCRWLKAGIGDISDGELLVVCLLSRDDWCVACQHEVNTRIWHQIGLKLSDINVQCTIEAK